MSEWLINYSWGKKTVFFFFPHFSEKKNTNFPNSSEGGTPKLLPGKKKTVPLKRYCKINAFLFFYRKINAFDILKNPLKI